MAPGPPKAIGKGLFTNGFTAMLLVERYAAGRSMNSLVTGLARQGAQISPATLAGTCAQAGKLLAPLAGAIAERNRDSWLPHADETTWRVFAPGDGEGPAKFWLWVFIIGPGTVCFLMDPSRSGKVLARHAGIGEESGQLLPDADGGPRRLVISSDFYAVYQAAGRKADGLVNLFCWSHLRRYFARAGDANPEQPRRWSDAWLDRIRDLYAAHDELMTAWQEAAAPPVRGERAAARLEKAYQTWDAAITVIGETRKEQAKGPGLAGPAKKAPATLDRQRDGLIAHRDYPMAGLDNNLAERAIRGPVVTRKNAGGSQNPGTACTAATAESPCPARHSAGSCPGTPAPRTSAPGPSRRRTANPRISNTATGVAPSDRHAGCRRALSQDFRALTPGAQPSGHLACRSRGMTTSSTVSRRGL